MELDRPTPVSHPPSFEWHLGSKQHTLGVKAGWEGKQSGGYGTRCVVPGAWVPFKGRRAGYRCWPV